MNKNIFFGVALGLTQLLVACGAPEGTVVGDKGGSKNPSLSLANLAITTEEDQVVAATLTPTAIDLETGIDVVVDEAPKHGTFKKTTAADGATKFTYTPDANYNGGDSITVHAEAGDTKSEQAKVTIQVTPVNDAPVALPASATLDEDGTQAIDGLLQATDIDGDVLTAKVVDAPVSGSVTVSPSGIFTYVPNADFNGDDSFTFSLSDGDLDSTPVTVSLTVTAINDAPSFAILGDQAVLEDAGPQSVASWTTAISAGPADEAAQGVTFAVTNDNAALFSAAPSVAGDGTLTYTPGADANGVASVTVTAWDDGGVTLGGNASASKTFTITVTAVNDAPAFTKGGNAVVLEDAGAQSTPTWATALSKGPANEAAQAITFAVTNDNADLFAVAPAVAGDGTLSYTPGADANGAATVTVIAWDDGGIANGGVSASAAQTFTITVNAVNDAPVFTKGGNVTVLEDAGAQSTPTWATAIANGPANEAAQTVTFAVTNDNAGLFSAAPAVASNGTLTYTPVAGANGAATVSITAWDNGGIANGGANASASQSFTITVTAVNDAPSFTKGGNAVILEDAGAQSIPTWATAISANESAQAVTFAVTNDNADLFAVAPAVAVDGALSYTPGADANGLATVTVTAWDDGGVANGGVNASAAQTFTITVNAVNDAPAFTKGANVTVLEDAGAQSAVTWATSISKGAANEAAQAITFAVTNDNAGLFSVAPALASNGTLSFTPSANASGSATVTLVAWDNAGTANAGVNQSVAQTFDITVTAVNDAPVLTGVTPSITMNEEGTAIITVTGTDVEGDPLLGVVVSHPALGFVTVSGTQITYHAGHNKSGSETLHVTINDGFDNAATWEPVSVTITALNDAPRPSAGAIGTSMGVTGTTRVTPHDPEGDAVTYSISTPPTNGVASVSASGWVSYTPDPAFSGDDALFVQVSDGSLSNTVLVEAVVLAPFSAPTLDEASVCASGNDVSYIVMDTPLNNASLSSDTDVTFTGSIIYNATYEWSTVTLDLDYVGTITSYTITPGCGTLSFSETVQLPNYGGYQASLYFWYVNTAPIFNVNTVGAPIGGGFLSSTLTYGQLITGNTLDETFVINYDFQGDTDYLYAQVAMYSNNFYSERLGVSPDAVTTPVRVRENLDCGSYWYLEVYGYGSSTGYFDRWTEFERESPKITSNRTMTDFPLNGQDVTTYTYVQGCNWWGVVQVTSTDPAFEVLTPEVTLSSASIEIVYRGSLLAPGEKREGFLVFTSSTFGVLERVPVSAVSHEMDLSSHLPTHISQTGELSLALPFEFPIDGTFYSQIELRSEGVFTFGQTLGSGDWPASNLTRPVDGSPADAGVAQGYPIFAPFWGSNHGFPGEGSDLSNVDVPADIYYRTVSDANGGYFELLYWDLNDGNMNARYVFRVRLYPDGRIEVIYDQLTASGFEISGYIDSMGNADLYPVWPIHDGTVRSFGPY